MKCYYHIRYPSKKAFCANHYFDVYTLYKTNSNYIDVISVMYEYDHFIDCVMRHPEIHVHISMHSAYSELNIISYCSDYTPTHIKSRPVMFVNGNQFKIKNAQTELT